MAHQVNTNLTLYGIINIKTGKLLGISTHSNGDDAEFCGDTTVRFEDDPDAPWVVSTENEAERALVEDSEWYNSGICHPCYSYAMKNAVKAGNLHEIFKVVRLDSTLTIL